MRPTHHTLTLLAQQTRLINACAGFRLEVQSGCLWLTRPGDAADRFMFTGSSIELHEEHVLIQSDPHPGVATLEAARYRLIPLQPDGPTPQSVVVAGWASLRKLWAKAGGRQASRMPSV